MRSLSNIIKGGRIRSHSLLDFSQRPVLDMAQRGYKQTLNMDIEISNRDDETTELIHKRKEELSLLEEEIQKKREEAYDEVNAILSEAHQKSEVLLNSAKEQEEKILKEAHQKQAEIIQLAHDEAEQIKVSANKEKQALLESVEDEIVHTMITMLKHIISEELNANVAWLKLIVRKMITSDPTSDTFKLYVSPKNMQLINQEYACFMEGISKVTEIKSEETLNDTSCILETSQGNIEYDVSQGVEKMITEIRILKSIS